MLRPSLPVSNSIRPVRGGATHALSGLRGSAAGTVRKPLSALVPCPVSALCADPETDIQLYMPETVMGRTCEAQTPNVGLARCGTQPARRALALTSR